MAFCLTEVPLRQQSCAQQKARGRQVRHGRDQRLQFGHRGRIVLVDECQAGRDQVCLRGTSGQLAHSRQCRLGIVVGTSSELRLGKARQGRELLRPPEPPGLVRTRLHEGRLGFRISRGTSQDVAAHQPRLRGIQGGRAGSWQAGRAPVRCGPGPPSTAPGPGWRASALGSWPARHGTGSRRPTFRPASPGHRPSAPIGPALGLATIRH